MLQPEVSFASLLRAHRSLRQFPELIVCTSAQTVRAGLGRLLSLYTVGRPADLALIVMAVELAAPVICILWQASIVRANEGE